MHVSILFQLVAIVFPVSLFIVRCIATLNFSLQETTLFYNWVNGTAYDVTHIMYDFTTMDQPGQQLLATN
jgi:hypothetical protein